MCQPLEVYLADKEGGAVAIPVRRSFSTPPPFCTMPESRLRLASSRMTTMTSCDLFEISIARRTWFAVIGLKMSSLANP